jgi:hypothetical protein
VVYEQHSTSSEQADYKRECEQRDRTSRPPPPVRDVGAVQMRAMEVCPVQRRLGSARRCDGRHGFERSVCLDPLGRLWRSGRNRRTRLGWRQWRDHRRARRACGLGETAAFALFAGAFALLLGAFGV